LIKYSAGYKYQLRADHLHPLDITVGQAIKDDWVMITLDGQLLIKKGYAWDGPSGEIDLWVMSIDITPDDKRNIRASLYHDALYGLMRRELLSKDYKGYADMLFYRTLLSDGFPKWKAKLWYWAVGKFGDEAVDQAKDIYVIHTKAD